MSDPIPEESTDTGSEQTGDTNTDTGTILTGDQGADVDTPEGEGQQDEGEGQSTEPESTTDEESSSDNEANSEVPETYEFTAPEGMEFDQKLVEAISPVFKDIGLTQEQATKLNGVFGEYMQGMQTEREEAFASQLNSWRAELQSDKSFGGDNFEKNSQAVRNFIDKTAPPEIKENLREFFFSTGAGNHPGLVKYFHQLAKTFPVDEDSPDAGHSSTNRDSNPLDDKLERWYGK